MYTYEYVVNRCCGYIHIYIYTHAPNLQEQNCEVHSTATVHNVAASVSVLRPGPMTPGLSSPADAVCNEPSANARWCVTCAAVYVYTGHVSVNILCL